jgi:hypothetical protein
MAARIIYAFLSKFATIGIEKPGIHPNKPPKNKGGLVIRILA